MRGKGNTKLEGEGGDTCPSGWCFFYPHTAKTTVLRKSFKNNIQWSQE